MPQLMLNFLGPSIGFEKLTWGYYRHVRVHHVDKDKDDPQLRDVLSQRPDGPSRGRRRRGPPT